MAYIFCPTFKRSELPIAMDGKVWEAVNSEQLTVNSEVLQLFTVSCSLFTAIIDMVIGYYPPFVIQHHAAALREYLLVAVVGIDRYHGIIYFFVDLFGILGEAGNR